MAKGWMKIAFWSWWQERQEAREKERDLRQRWRETFGCELVRPGELGHEQCLQVVQRVAIKYRGSIIFSMRRARDLAEHLPPPRDPVLIWADLLAAETELKRLISEWGKIRQLIQEARIVLVEDSIPPVVEDLADQT